MSSWLGAVLLLLGILVIVAPLGWIAVNRLQSRSDQRYQQQQNNLDQRYR